MNEYKIADIEQSIINKIKAVEEEIKKQTGKEIALIAYSRERDSENRMN